ncbi:hypothetical protein B296_00016811 [Ensete ventricosum]|uniref:Uncharacterized protein n=1 Tax=Ensete ventricosum TaxID=4639 RepID=A0A427B343_ENSVE|nr:hypothetical protein B296_00016811 [Ensete ventricosum]
MAATAVSVWPHLHPGPSSFFSMIAFTTEYVGACLGPAATACASTGGDAVPDAGSGTGMRSGKRPYDSVHRPTLLHRAPGAVGITSARKGQGYGSHLTTTRRRRSPIARTRSPYRIATSNSDEGGEEG